MKETPQPSIVILNTHQFSPGGGSERGPWGPKAIQYAENKIYVSFEQDLGIDRRERRLKGRDFGSCDVRTLGRGVQMVEVL